MGTLRSGRLQPWGVALATLVVVLGVLVTQPAGASTSPLPVSDIATATPPLGGAGNMTGDTVAFTSSSGVAGTATFASSVSDFATVAPGSLTFLTPMLATASGPGTGTYPANAGDTLVVWNSGTTTSPNYSYFDATTQSPSGSGVAFMGFTLTNSGGTLSLCVTASSCDQNNAATDNVFGLPPLAVNGGGTQSGWSLAQSMTVGATVETTGGTLGTGSYSLTISNPGTSGSGAGAGTGTGTGTGTGSSSGTPLPAANVDTATAASPGAGNVAGDTVAFTSSSGVTGTATYASSVSDFATVTNGSIDVTLPSFIASASATGSGTTPANAGDALAVWNSGSASSPLYTYVDVTTQSAATSVNGGTVGFSFINPGGTATLCQQAYCGAPNSSPVVFESPIAGGTVGAQSGWNVNIGVPPTSFTIVTTGGTLGTGTYSETITTAGFTGAAGGSGTGSSGPPTLAVAAQHGQVGHSLTMQVTGNVTGLSVAYSVTNGTASGCSITGDTLVATSAGTCMVVATEIAPGNITVTTSTPTAISFVLPAKPAAITTGFAVNASVLSVAAKRSLIALSKKLTPGAKVVVTGFARANVALARRRAIAAANFLRSHVHVVAVVRVVTKFSANKVTVITLKQ